MAKSIKTIDYDPEYDIFWINNGEKVKASIDIGSFVIDVSHKNLICGLEVMDATENLGISKEALEDIKSIKMSVQYRTNHVYVLLMLAFKQQEKEVNIQIPLTLNLGHKTPKNELLVYN
jgi:uncharacterized protein YuzE